jgi:hypothetical protein
MMLSMQPAQMLLEVTSKATSILSHVEIAMHAEILLISRRQWQQRLLRTWKGEVVEAPYRFQTGDLRGISGLMQR